ncbi:Pre-mRNA-splicing factor ATP-dependent RNA helicase [Arachis hypogaea]|nr:Pre-mRNA-splicing factor ATP-dependent RNA helicase [Arachis hypogaea]
MRGGITEMSPEVVAEQHVDNFENDFKLITNKMSRKDEVTDKSEFGEEHKYEITESMRAEMEYDADRAWYDREEGSTMFDGGDNSSLFSWRRGYLSKKRG